MGRAQVSTPKLKSLGIIHDGLTGLAWPVSDFINIGTLCIQINTK